jgi:hypothetical protein
MKVCGNEEHTQASWKNLVPCMMNAHVRHWKQKCISPIDECWRVYGRAKDIKH